MNKATVSKASLARKPDPRLAPVRSKEEILADPSPTMTMREAAVILDVGMAAIRSAVARKELAVAWIGRKHCKVLRAPLFKMLGLQVAA